MKVLDKISGKIRNAFDASLHNPLKGRLNILRYIGPGLLVTVGFIDPGNWASNLSAGSDYGYKLLWMVTLSTIMLIILQHNTAHLGIVTGDCLSEAASKHLNPILSKIILSTAVGASISTAIAELLGGAVAIKMLFGIPLKIGVVLILATVLFMLFSNSYKKIEKIIIGFVSIIGLSFLYEIWIAKISWNEALTGWFVPQFPEGSMPIIMAVLGAVVMPHNLFLHSEIIQSREWNKENEEVIKKQLKYEFIDTLFSMIVGWAINSAMILLAASSFFTNGVKVSELEDAKNLLVPIAGNGAALVFGIALLFSGISSSITAGMAGGSIFAGMFKEPYDIKDIHSKVGVIGILSVACVIIFFVDNPLMGLIYSQMILSIQLPITIFLQIFLTSSKKVMGKYRNSVIDSILLWTIGIIVTVLNIFLFISFFK